MRFGGRKCYGPNESWFPKRSSVLFQRSVVLVPVNYDCCKSAEMKRRTSFPLMG